jgi:excisionase family DNA binding protein
MIQTIRQLAQEEKISESSIRQWVKEGKLQAIRPGGKGKIYIDRTDWTAFIEHSRVKISADKDVMALLRGLCRKTA